MTSDKVCLIGELDKGSFITNFNDREDGRIYDFMVKFYTKNNEKDIGLWVEDNAYDSNSKQLLTHKSLHSKNRNDLTEFWKMFKAYRLFIKNRKSFDTIFNVIRANLIIQALDL